MMSIIIYAWATIAVLQALHLLDSRTSAQGDIVLDFNWCASVTAAMNSLGGLLITPISTETVSVYEALALFVALYVGGQYLIIPAFDSIYRNIEMYFRMKDNLGNQSADKAIIGAQAIVTQVTCLLAILLESRIDPFADYLVGIGLWYLVILGFLTFGPMILEKMEA